MSGDADNGAPYPAARRQGARDRHRRFRSRLLSICRDRFSDVRSAKFSAAAVRDRVAYSAYLFYKFEKHRDDPGYPQDDWGEALAHEQMVEQARRMIEDFGFGSIKLKAGRVRA